MQIPDSVRVPYLKHNPTVYNLPSPNASASVGPQCQRLQLHLRGVMSSARKPLQQYNPNLSLPNPREHHNRAPFLCCPLRFFCAYHVFCHSMLVLLVKRFSYLNSLDMYISTVLCFGQGKQIKRGNRIFDELF